MKEEEMPQPLMNLLEEEEMPQPLMNLLDIDIDYQFSPESKKLLGLKLTWRDRLKLLKRWFKERVVMV